MNQDNNTIQKITSKVVSKSIESLGEKLSRIVLYGSYARGDFTPESDIDVMIIIDCKHEELPKYRRMVSKIASEISLDDDVELSLVLEDIYTYDKLLDTLVFYQNVKKEINVHYMLGLISFKNHCN